MINNRYKQFIGIILLMFGIMQLITGLISMPLIPSYNVITLIIGSPLITICFILVGLLLIFNKEKIQNKK